MMESVRIYRLITGLVLLVTVMAGCSGSSFRASLKQPTLKPSHQLAQQQESLIEELRRVLVFSAGQPQPATSTVTTDGNATLPNGNQPEHLTTHQPAPSIPTAVVLDDDATLPNGNQPVHPTTHQPALPIPTAIVPDDDDALPNGNPLPHQPAHTDSPVKQVKQGPSTLSTPMPSPHLEAASTTYHTVVAGDTLSEIALKYMGKPSAWEEIWIANPSLTSPNRLKVGQSLLIPSSPKAVVADAQAAPQVPVNHLSHTVRSGDSLRALAQHYLGQAELWHLLVRANPNLSPPFQIYPGDTLIIPTGAAVEETLLAIQADALPTNTIGYTVRPGDTLGAIAQHYLGSAVLWAALMDANPAVTDPMSIFPGQVLVIPSPTMARSKHRLAPSPDA